MVRKDTPGVEQSGAPRELLNVSLRQSYYTDAKASKFDQSYSYGFGNRAPNAFSPISLVARTTPVTPLAVDYRLEYDAKALPNNPKLLGMGLNGTFLTPAANLTGGWSRQSFPTVTASGGVVSNPTSNNYMQTAADFRVKQGTIGGRVEFNYNFANSTLVNQRYLAFFNAQCCGVSFEYQAFNYPNNPNQFLLPRDRRFNMSFTLAGVGSFSNFFGAFGGSTY
jgi:hypothetical protein